MYPVYVRRSHRKIYVGVSGQEYFHYCFSVFNIYCWFNSAQAPELCKFSLAVHGAVYEIKALEIALQPENNLEVIVTPGKALN